MRERRRAGRWGLGLAGLALLSRPALATEPPPLPEEVPAAEVLEFLGQWAGDLDWLAAELDRPPPRDPSKQKVEDEQEDR